MRNLPFLLYLCDLVLYNICNILSKSYVKYRSKLMPICRRLESRVLSSMLMHLLLQVLVISSVGKGPLKLLFLANLW